MKSDRKGYNNTFYGKHHTQETKNKLSEMWKGKRSGSNNPHFGKHHSEYSKLKIGNNKERNKKISLGKLGNKNPNWVGDKITYNALHSWVRRYLTQSELCQCCNEKPSYDLANITGVYNREFINWKYLCRRCHMISDGRIYTNLHHKQTMGLPVTE